MDNGILQLAFNVYNNPGVYALLLGSGLSRSAEILTGWEIVGDLIRQIAFTLGENPQNPQKWYRTQYREEPRYDSLLEKLAPTAAERNSILRPYFEPTEEERERGAKLPTPAHRAIASMIRNGYIRVVLTTNFDRLLETALGDIGIVPDVLSTDDMLQGRTPIRHSPITIVKLHGDYRDWRSLNTEEELGTYSDAKVQILDEIFNDYGLIVCGWSARWDTALRDALYRAPSRRYTTYWAAHGEVSGEAKDLMRHRRAQVISISNADNCFTEIDRTIDAFTKSKRPDPLSIQVLIERVKKLIPRNESQIELDDLLRTVMRQAFEASTSKEILERRQVFLDSGNHDIAFQKIPPIYFDAVEPLIHVMAGLSWYGNESYSGYFANTINQWGEDYYNISQQHAIWGSFPLITIIYSAGIASVSRNHWFYLKPLLVDPRIRLPYNERDMSFLDILGQEFLLPVIHSVEPSTWLSTYLEQQLRPTFRSYIPSDTAYQNTFDLFETILALVYLRTTTEAPNVMDWMPHHLAYESRRSRGYIEEFWRKEGKLSYGKTLDDSIGGLLTNTEGLLTKYQEIVPTFQHGITSVTIGIPNYLAAYRKGKEDILT